MSDASPTPEVCMFCEVSERWSVYCARIFTRAEDDNVSVSPTHDLCVKYASEASEAK